MGRLKRTSLPVCVVSLCRQNLILIGFGWATRQISHLGLERAHGLPHFTELMVHEDRFFQLYGKAIERLHARCTARHVALMILLT